MNFGKSMDIIIMVLSTIYVNNTTKSKNPKNEAQAPTKATKNSNNSNSAPKNTQT